MNKISLAASEGIIKPTIQNSESKKSMIWQISNKTATNAIN